ncbi:MAG: sulfite exporter TauE/SafE family protein [Gammaproteobacteria bacterium]
MITDPVFYAVAVPAVILLGLAKGGFSGLGVLAVPLMTLVASPIEAASITLPILIVQDVVSVWVFRRAWDGRSLTVLLPSASVGILAGYLFAARVSPAQVELAIGIVAVVFSVRQLWVQFHGIIVPARKSSDVAGVLWGSVCGFTSQIAHAGGVPFQLYMLPKRLERDVFIGTSALFFAAMNWLKVPAYFALGQLTRPNLATSVALFPVAVASTIAGAWLIRRVSGPSFYTAMYLLLLVVGMKLIWSGTVG